jgi:hypothetical protein
MPPVSFSLLLPRLAELLQSPARSGLPAPSPYAAVPTASVGLFTSSHMEAPAPAPFSQPLAPTASAPPASPVASNALALQQEFAARADRFASGGAGDSALGELAVLTSQYGSRVPLSDYPAHGPRCDAAPDFASGHGAGHLYNVAPLVSPLRHSDPIATLGPTSFSPTPTAPVHFVHNLPIKLTRDNYLFWHA